MDDIVSFAADQFLFTIGIFLIAAVIVLVHGVLTVQNFRLALHSNSRPYQHESSKGYNQQTHYRDKPVQFISVISASGKFRYTLRLTIHTAPP